MSRKIGYAARLLEIEIRDVWDLFWSAITDHCVFLRTPALLLVVERKELLISSVAMLVVAARPEIGRSVAVTVADPVGSLRWEI